MTKNPADLLIGVHASVAGGVENALFTGEELGATTVQIFSRNQKQWAAKPFSQKELDNWQAALKETHLKKIMVHDSYLINLGSPRQEILAKSRKAFREELKRCHQLGVSFLNFHPGAALTSSEEECLNLIVESIEEVADLAAEGPTRLLIETTAGQGSNVGHDFEHLAYLIQNLHDKVPIGVCIDTCHIFAAGYDISTPKAWKETLGEFDKVVGRKYLNAFHLNDSLKPLGSRRDRHANLGKGEIGIDCFKFLMQDPDLREIPKYLETPNGSEFWKDEIQMLRDFAK